MTKLSVFVATVLVALGLVLPSSASAGTLATESGDRAYPSAPTFTAIAGSSTVTGTPGPTPTDGQDPFNVTVPSTLNVTSVSYSGPAGPHNLVGCGLTGTSVLNQSFSTSNTSCTLSWFINADFMVSPTAWTVTIVTEAVAAGDTEAPTISVPADITVANDPGQASAAVNFTATATDNAPGVTVACIPASGTAFPIGTSTVTCTAEDAADNTSTASFDVTVNETEPPCTIEGTYLGEGPISTSRTCGRRHASW